MKKITAVIALTAAAVFPLTACQNLVKNDPVTCKVVDKDRSTDHEGKSVFRIYTEGPRCDDTYGLDDNIFQGNFNTADMYAKIRQDKTYTFETVGVRNGFFSSFKEIVRFTEVKPTEPK